MQGKHAIKLINSPLKKRLHNKCGVSQDSFSHESNRLDKTSSEHQLQSLLTQARNTKQNTSLHYDGERKAAGPTEYAQTEHADQTLRPSLPFNVIDLRKVQQAQLNEMVSPSLTDKQRAADFLNQNNKAIPVARPDAVATSQERMPNGFQVLSQRPSRSPFENIMLQSAGVGD